MPKRGICLAIYRGRIMSVIHSSLFHLLKKYPDRREEVKALFKTDESFKSICDDYLQCDEVLNYWSNSSKSEAFMRKAEYEQLLADLENELKYYLLKTG